jgi:hypothetical protein
VGINGHLPSIGSISNCYSTGYILCDNWSWPGLIYWASIGGLVGGNGEFSNISNCYSLVEGDVGDATDYSYRTISVGGLVGSNLGSVSNCYSAGWIEPFDITNPYVGTLVGVNISIEDIATVSNCSMYCHPYLNAIGKNDGGTVTNIWCLTTTRSTFIDAGWDFVGETNNGTEDIWTMHDGVYYPQFVWELVNFIGWYEVDFLDFAIFANYWMDSNYGYYGPDLDFSGKVDGADMKIFFDHWLEGIQ